MASIQVTHITGSTYDVTVDDGRGTTRHAVTVWPSDVARYAPDATPEALIEASFEFLLEREPKEAILRKFKTLQPNQFSSSGMGWSRPADPNDPLNHAKNRRVEIKGYPLEAAH